MTAIGDVTVAVSTWNPNRVPRPSTFDYIDLSAIDNTLKEITTPTRLSSQEAPSRARQIVSVGDVLVSTVRPNLNAVAIVPPALDGATASTGFTVLRPNDRAVGRYLYHWVRSDRFIADMVRKATGASYPAVSDRIVKNSLLPLPSLDEQRRVAAMLDLADVLRAKRRLARAALDRLSRATYAAMFGEPRDSWPLKALGEVTECLDSSRRPVKESERPAGPVPYYGANGQQGWIDRPLFNEPLVLVAEDGGHFAAPERGVAYEIDGPAWVNNHAHILRPGASLLVEYLHRTLRHYDFTPYISGSTRSKLTQGQMKSAKIRIPPIELQEDFAMRVASISMLSNLHEQAALHEEALILTMHSRAF